MNSKGLLHRAGYAAALAVSWLAVTVAAQAQSEIRLETLEVSAEGEPATGPDQGIVAKRSKSGSKTATSLVETPQVVNVVTRDQMDAQGATTMSEALRYTPGILSDPNGFDTRYDWLYIRGFNAYGTTWLDGLNFPGDPSGYAAPRISGYALERVEVLKGPASVLYGRSIPGGLVNQVSKRPQSETHREAVVSTTGFGGIQGAVDMTGRLTEDGEWLYRFTGLAKNLNTQIDHERDRQIMLSPSVTWSPTADTTLTLYGYFQRDTPVFSPRFYPAVGTLLPSAGGQIPRNVFLGDPTWGNFDRDVYAVGYEFEHNFSETWTVRQNLRYSGADQDMNLVLVNPAFARNAPGTTLERVTAMANDHLRSFAVDTQAEARFDTGAFDHTALLGMDFVHATSDTQFGNSAPGLVSPIDYLNPIYGGTYPVAPVSRSGLQTQKQLGLYAQDQIRYDRWVGTFGLRYDFSDIESVNRITNTQVTNRTGALTGRAGLTYLFDNGLAPYVSYSTSFLPLLGSDVNGDPYAPLEARQFEAGVKYEPVGGRGMITLSVFDLETKNALTPDPASPNPARPLGYVQSGKQSIRGFEIEGKYEVTPQLDILAAYAYTHSRVLSSNYPVELGREVLRLPEHQGALWVNYRPDLIEGLSLSAGVRATSDYQSDSTYLPELRIPSRVLVDIGAEYDFGALRKEFEGTKLRVNVSNLFDETYVSHCTNATGGSCNYGAGRTVSASLKYEW